MHVCHSLSLPPSPPWSLPSLLPLSSTLLFAAKPALLCDHCSTRIHICYGKPVRKHVIFPLALKKVCSTNGMISLNVLNHLQQVSLELTILGSPLAMSAIVVGCIWDPVVSEVGYWNTVALLLRTGALDIFACTISHVLMHCRVELFNTRTFPNFQ